MAEATKPTRTTQFASESNAYISEPPAAVQNRGFTPARLSVEVTITSVLNETGYTVTIDTNPFTYASDTDATAAEIRDGLIALINANPAYEATSSDTNKFRIVSSAVGISFAVTLGSYLSMANVTVAGMRPPAEWVNWPLRALHDLVTWICDKINRIPGNTPPTELTISAGSITAVLGSHIVDTESDAASDYLDTIVPSNLDSGRLLFLSCANSARSVVIRNGQGATNRIFTADGLSVTLNNTKRTLVLRLMDGDWYEVSFSAIRESLVPTGWCGFIAGSTCPEGYLVRDGSLVLRADYPQLYATIGDAWGANDGVTNFRLPLANGRVDVGYDAGDSLFDEVGIMGGENSHSITIAEMPSHSHSKGFSLDGHYAAGTGGDPTVRPVNTAGSNTGATGSGNAMSLVQKYGTYLPVIKT